MVFINYLTRPLSHSLSLCFRNDSGSNTLRFSRFRLHMSPLNLSRLLPSILSLSSTVPLVQQLPISERFQNATRYLPLPLLRSPIFLSLSLSCSRLIAVQLNLNSLYQYQRHFIIHSRYTNLMRVLSTHPSLMGLNIGSVLPSMKL